MEAGMNAGQGKSAIMESEKTADCRLPLPTAPLPLLTAAVLLAIWLGAAVFFSFAVAPSAFGVLRGAQVTAADELAGAIVSRVLAIINLSGFVVGLAAALGIFLARRRILTPETVLAGLVALTTGAGQWIIGARLTALRAAAGRPLAKLAKSDPLRAEFDKLHGYSVIVLTIGMMAALLAIIVITRRTILWKQAR